MQVKYVIVGKLISVFFYTKYKKNIRIKNLR